MLGVARVGRCLALALLLSLVPDTQSLAQGATTRIERDGAVKLHALAGEALLPRVQEHRGTNPDLEALLQALDALGRDLAAAEREPSARRLRSVASQRRGAESAFTTLRGRMAAQSSERADELAARFAPLWSDIDDALAARSDQRRERLTAARERLQQARSRRGDVHTTSIVVTPFGAER